jgi:hypothetical protein
MRDVALGEDRGELVGHCCEQVHRTSVGLDRPAHGFAIDRQAPRGLSVLRWSGMSVVVAAAGLLVGPALG